MLDYKIDNLNIGLDIYESYLIRYHLPTIEDLSKSNDKLSKIVSEALKNYIFWKFYFKNNKAFIKGVFLSHRNYIETNIINRISIKEKIKVFTTSGETHTIQRWKDDSLNFFQHYNKIFSLLNFSGKKSY